MSRGTIGVARPVAVLLAATLAALTTGRAVPPAWHAVAAAGGTRSSDAVADALVAGCATVLAVALGWLWLVTAATVAQLLAGATPTGAGATRRLVMLACGAAVVAGTAVPAHADGGGGGAEHLVGLSLPERAVAPVTRSSEPRAGAVTSSHGHAASPASYVVRPGDSLWSIAQAHPGDSDDVGLRWREIWAANRVVVGADPDLIHPGQALVLPGDHPRTRTHEDGEG